MDMATPYVRTEVELPGVIGMEDKAALHRLSTSIILVVTEHLVCQQFWGEKSTQ